MANADTSTIGADELDSDDVVTVTTLNDEIAEVIGNTSNLDHEYVVGDVSDCRQSNGHLHFDLVPEEASIHCVAFCFRNQQLNATPDDAMHVAVNGDLSYYEQQGSCSIIVDDVIDVGGSEYSQVYAENKQRLKEDGLLADDRKESPPELPRRVGLVTSADSDARIDAVTAIHDRYPDVDITLQDASVKGDDALKELMHGVATLDKDHTVDVIVVTRGGGADKTLRVFNETPLYRVIADTNTPTAVGIGHEDDRTLADEVADFRFMTPTHAGEFDRKRSELSERLDTAYRSAVETELTGLQTSLDTAYESTVSNRLQELDASLEHATDRHAEAALIELRNQLHTAYRTLKQEKKHEAQLEETVEEVRDEAKSEVQAEMANQQRRYKIAIAVLVLVVLGLAALYVIP